MLDAQLFLPLASNASVPLVLDLAPPTAVIALDDTMASAKEYLQAAKSTATRRAYESDARDFKHWCEAHGLCPLPAELSTAAGYLASLADRGLKASTIPRRAAAIRYLHRSADLEPPTNAEAFRELLKGIRRTLGTAPIRKAPVTAERLAAMLEALPGSLRGKRDRAMLAIG